MNYNEIQGEINALTQTLSNTNQYAIRAFEGDPHPQWEQIKIKRQETRDALKQIKSDLQAMIDQQASGVVGQVMAANTALDSDNGESFDPGSLIAMIDFIPWDLSATQTGMGV